jgi:hypothetical protein
MILLSSFSFLLILVFYNVARASLVGYAVLDDLHVTSQDGETIGKAIGDAMKKEAFDLGCTDLLVERLFFNGFNMRTKYYTSNPTFEVHKGVKHLCIESLTFWRNIESLELPDEHDCNMEEIKKKLISREMFVGEWDHHVLVKQVIVNGSPYGEIRLPPKKAAPIQK